MTPNPTPTETMALLNRAGHRPQVAWNEVLRILKAVLPGALAEANSRYGLKLPLINGMAVAGELAPTAGPFVEVAISPGLDVMGVEGFADNSQLLISFSYEAGTVDRFKANYVADIASIARAVLWHYAGPHFDTKGRNVWSQLKPASVSLGPWQLDKRVGVTLHYNLQRYPDQDSWTLDTGTALPDPTGAEVCDVLPLAGGRLSLAREAVLDICERLSLPLLAAMNAEYGTQLKKLNGYHVVGEHDLRPAPFLLVSATSQTIEESPRVFADEVNLNIHCIGGTGDTRWVRDDNADMACAVKALLMSYYGGYVDADGLTAWTELMPLATPMGSMPFEQMTGTTLRYRALQGPGENRW